MPVVDADTKTQRLLELQMLFWRNPKRNLRTSEIAEYLGVTERTARNYLDELSTSAKLPIYKEGWEWRLMEGARMSLPPLNLDLEEGAQLYLAARLLARHSDEPNPAIRAALVKLIAAMPPTLSGHLERLVAGLPTQADPHYADIFHAMVYGWATRHVVDLEYHPLKARPYQARFYPYLLEPSAIGYTVYAIGHSDPPDALRTYKLERIVQAELTGEPFDLPADFDGLALLKQAWGVMYSEETQTVTLRFAPGIAARRVKETVWHPSQTYHDLDNGGVEWSAQVGDWLEMLPWIRGWGKDVEVLAPKQLRWAIRSEARHLARLYGVATTEQNSPQARVLRCWGKTVKGSTDFHPAVFHMLDTGYVARELLSERASPRWRRVLAEALGADADTLVDWLPWFVALHDIGKISATFQMSDRKKAQKARLEAEGFSFGRWRPSLNLHHKDVGQVFVANELELSLPKLLLRVWREMVAGHHGQFAASGSQKQARTMIESYEPSEWADLRATTTKILQDHLLKQPPNAWPAPTNISTAIMALTGFTILCDWLGSDARNFLPQSGADLVEYADESARLARRAVEKAGFFQPSRSAAPTGFAVLFPDKTPPRPLQTAIDGIPADLLSEPCLVVMEAPTGEGKTEAALALAHRLAQSSGTDELYCALPTTATSNQMFVRLQEHLHDRLDLPTQVKLIHGQAFLVEDDLRLEPLSNGQRGDDTASLEWFSPKKLSLLAPFGVGTIDQAELAALNVKHNALRVIGLAGKVVIVDEVHAYDVYMTAIVERLLTWLSALGASVILLSATLPAARRAALARAYSGKSDLDLPDPRAYPSLWTVSRNDSHQATPRAYQPDRKLEIGDLHLPDDDPQAKADWLLQAVADGGCACWITNTVKRAQTIFEAIPPKDRERVDCALLHARFPLEERQKLEKALNDKYGPTGDRPKRGIVIGTQVLEQSLDLDFDVMVSDLAPIDLLLQRAGRLHRHQRGERGTPRLWINVELDADGDPKVDVDRYIYAEYILRKSWQTLREQSGPAINLPDDYRPLIEAVYDEVEPAPDSPLRDAWQKLKKQQAHALGEANLRLLPEPDPRWPFCAGARMTFEENEDSAAWIVAQTRLGRESVTAIPLERDGNRARLYPTNTTVALDTAAPREMQLQLLRRSLRLSQWHVVQALKAEQDERPRLFTESALLKGCLPLWLSDGQLQISTTKGTMLIALDPERGLIIRKEGV